MDSVRSVQYCQSSPITTETDGSMDNDPAFQQIAEGAWAEIRQFINNPTKNTAELAMMGVNTLSDYFNKNGIPTQAENPLAYAIYQDMQSDVPGWTYTISQVCAYVGSDEGNTFANNLAVMQQQGNPPFGTLANPYTHDPGTGLEKDINALGSVNDDNSNKFIFMDLYFLQEYLHQNDGSDSAAQNIAIVIKDLNEHIVRAHAKDGYLTSLYVLFHLPITTASGTSDLYLLASNYDPSNAASVTAFKSALASLNEGGGQAGQLYQLVRLAYVEEEYGVPPPFPGLQYPLG